MTLDPDQHARSLGRTGASTGDRTARTLALVVGATFLLVGVLGFVPGITTGYDDLGFAGHHSEAKLLGLFQVSVLHNLLHLALGLAGVLLARRADTAVRYLVGGGVAYLGLWVYGLAVDHHSDANVIPLNDADNWLHLVLGVGMVALGVLAHRALRGGIGSQTPM
ncbi:MULTISPECIES: DUF4383 domain-containing protein [unclassified Nocardioides]|uniref:DUF4383 domain-containing protein n=1 Tax=unclassified Nocardioides TaxID=2615069 RepID=UPI003014E160